MLRRWRTVLLISLLFLAACSISFRVPNVADMPDRSIGSVDYGPMEPAK